MICNQMTKISSSESFKVNVLYFEMDNDANKNND